MTKEIYIDTNVFISYWDVEYGRNITDYLEYYAGELLQRTLRCEFTILFSESVLNELKRKIEPTRLKALLGPFYDKKKIKYFNLNKEMGLRAKEICKKYGTHYADALHAAAAEYYDAPMITWNLKDFEFLDFLEVRTPKDL